MAHDTPGGGRPPYLIHQGPDLALSPTVRGDTLQLIAQGVAELAGFAVATISVFRPNGEMETIAAAGDDEVPWAMVGQTAPTSVVLELLDLARHWGPLLRFVPHEESAAFADDISRSAGTVVDASDAWQPLDLLMAPLVGDDETLQGILAVDRPLDGRRPGPEQRRLLERYADQAARAVLRTFEHERRAEQIRLAEAARRVVRTASASLDLNSTLEACRPVLLEGFGCTGLWIRVLPTDEEPQGRVHRYPEAPDETDAPADVAAMALRLGRRCWAQQRVALLGPDRLAPGLLSPADHRVLREHFGTRGITSLMLVPLGAGDECLGALALARHGAGLEWSDVEATAALDVGHDLGRAILNARLFERERRLAHELRELGGYQARLHGRLADELKPPLSTILGNVALLQGAPDLGERGKVSVAAISESADRLARLVDDLSTLADRPGAGTLPPA